MEAGSSSLTNNSRNFVTLKCPRPYKPSHAAATLTNQLLARKVAFFARVDYDNLFRRTEWRRARPGSREHAEHSDRIRYDVRTRRAPLTETTTPAGRRPERPGRHHACLGLTPLPCSSPGRRTCTCTYDLLFWSCCVPLHHDLFLMVIGDLASHRGRRHGYTGRPSPRSDDSVVSTTR